MLGTKFTMEKDFYVGHVRARGLNVIVPDAYGRDLVNRVIYDELCCGQVFDGSRQAYVDEIGALGLRGAEAVILGCTEIGRLIDDDNSPLPTFDTTAIHAAAAAEFCTGRGPPLAECPLSTHCRHWNWPKSRHHFLAMLKMGSCAASGLAAKAAIASNTADLAFVTGVAWDARRALSVNMAQGGQNPFVYFDFDRQHYRVAESQALKGGLQC